MKHVRTAFVCLFLPAFAAAQTVQFKMPHSGDSAIRGNVPPGNAGAVVTLNRIHADGHSDSLTATPDASGNFTASLPTSDKLGSGDKITGTLTPAAEAKPTVPTAPQPALPAVMEVVATVPPIIRFASGLKQTRGATVNVTISSKVEWPKALLGDQTVTVVADDAVQYPDGTAATGGLPAASTLTVTLSTGKALSDATIVNVEDPLCEWGRVRCYAYFGAIFSQTNSDFSKTDPYFDFSVEWNWLKGRHGTLTTFFDTRLTTIPTPAPSAATASSGTATTTPSSTTAAAAPSPADAFAESSKSPQVLGGVYYAPWTLPAWTFKDDPYGLFAAALYKGGVQGRLDGVIDSIKLAFPDQGKSVYTFNAAGIRVGFVKAHPGTSDANDLLSYLDFTVGKYRLYDYVGPDFQGAPGGASNVRHYGLRKVFEGRIKIPRVNLRIGADANLGQGQNDLRFLVTTNAIDIFKGLVGQK